MATTIHVCIQWEEFASKHQNIKTRDAFFPPLIKKNKQNYIFSISFENFFILAQVVLAWLAHGRVGLPLILRAALLSGGVASLEHGVDFVGSFIATVDLQFLFLW
jgi:hypothetical protein